MHAPPPQAWPAAGRGARCSGPAVPARNSRCAVRQSCCRHQAAADDHKRWVVPCPVVLRLLVVGRVPIRRLWRYAQLHHRPEGVPAGKGRSMGGLGLQRVAGWVGSLGGTAPAGDVSAVQCSGLCPGTPLPACLPPSCSFFACCIDDDHPNTAAAVDLAVPLTGNPFAVAGSAAASRALLCWGYTCSAAWAPSWLLSWAASCARCCLDRPELVGTCGRCPGQGCWAARQCTAPSPRDPIPVPTPAHDPVPAITCGRASGSGVAGAHPD